MPQKNHSAKRRHLTDCQSRYDFLIDMSKTETAAAPAIVRGEIWRKVLHMSPGLLPFLLVLVPHPDPLGPVELINLSVLIAVLTGVFLASHRIVRRPGETDFLVTVLSYPGTILITLILFRANAEFATVVLCVLAFGDGAAFVSGKLFGRKPLPWNPQKTWAGSIGFVLCAAPTATMAYWLEAANPSAPLVLAVICGTAASIAGSLAESIETDITDNLRVGVAAAVTVVATHFIAAPWFLG